MSKIRVLLAAVVMAGAAFVVPTSASTAAPPPLTITCTQSPAACVAVGQLGPLFGVTVLTPSGDEVILCINRTHVPCGVAKAVLIIRPGLFFANADVGSLAGGTLVITAHSLFGVAGIGTYLVTLVGYNGLIAARIPLLPGHAQCLVLDHLKLTTAAC